MENLAPDIVRQRLLIEGFYGIDIGLRDPFGNHIRITQLVSQN